MLLNSCWQFEDTLSLSSNDRICGFNWIRGSKHCFLTSFSNLYRYFLLLLFLQNCYLLVSLHLSRLRGNQISHPVFIPFILWIPRCTWAHIFLAHMTHFLKARCSWETGTRISTGILSPFCLLPKVSHANVCWVITSHTFFSHINPWTDTFSRDISLHKVNAVQLGKGIPKGFPNLWIKADCCFSDDSFWTTLQVLFALDRVPAGSLQFIPFDSAHLPCYKFPLQRVPQWTLAIWHASQSQSRGTSYLWLAVVSNCQEAQWVWRAWVGADWSTSLSCSLLVLQGFWGSFLMKTSQSRICL